MFAEECCAPLSVNAGDSVWKEKGESFRKGLWPLSPTPFRLAQSFPWYFLGPAAALA